MAILTSSEICSIIKACADSRVSELSFRGLKLVFGTPATMGPTFQDANQQSSDPQTAEKLEKQVLFVEEAETRRDQLDHMLIEDPAEYERLMLAGELEDNGHTET